MMDAAEPVPVIATTAILGVRAIPNARKALPAVRLPHLTLENLRARSYAGLRHVSLKRLRSATAELRPRFVGLNVQVPPRSVPIANVA